MAARLAPLAVCSASLLDSRRRSRSPEPSLGPASPLAQPTPTGWPCSAPSPPVDTLYRGGSLQVNRLPSTPPTSACMSSVGSRRASASLLDTPSTSQRHTLPSVGDLKQSTSLPGSGVRSASHLSQCQGCIQSPPSLLSVVRPQPRYHTQCTHGGQRNHVRAGPSSNLIVAQSPSPHCSQ